MGSPHSLAIVDNYRYKHQGAPSSIFLIVTWHLYRQAIIAQCSITMQKPQQLSITNIRFLFIDLWVGYDCSILDFRLGSDLLHVSLIPGFRHEGA